MQSTTNTPEEYIENLPEDRKQIISKIRTTMIENLPSGFLEVMSYGMLSYVVPHSLYPKGYHCDPKLPLQFISVASQKGHIAIHHMGMYFDEKLIEWFKEEWNKISTKKLDIGKSCIRFKKPEDVPLELIGALVRKITPQEWVELYEKRE